MAGLIEIKSKQFAAVGQALQAIGGSIEKQIDDATRKMEPEWKRLVSSKATSLAEKRLIGATAKIETTGPGVRLVTSVGRLRNGLNTADHGGAVEFGVKRGKKSTYRRKGRKGGSHSVTRVTTNQLRSFQKTGYVFTPSVKAFVPRLKKAWTEAVTKAAEDALNGKG